MILRCEYPVEADACGRPAMWETEDLEGIAYLCDEHCREALVLNDFFVDRVAS